MTDAAAGPGLLDGLRVLGALAFVVVLAYLLARLARRSGMVTGANRALRIVDRIAVARGSQLLLVEADGRRLLIGVAEKSVNLLTPLGPAAAGETAEAGGEDEAEEADAAGFAPAAPPVPNTFAARLARRLVAGGRR